MREQVGQSYRGTDLPVDLEGLTPLDVEIDDEDHGMQEPGYEAQLVLPTAPVPVAAPSSAATTKPSAMGGKIDLGDDGGNAKSIPRPVEVSWLQQLKWNLYKNRLLLSRRPITLFFMIFSSVFSVLLAWPAGRDVEGTFPSELDQCGVIPVLDFREKRNDGSQPYYTSEYEPDDYILSLNERWRNGIPVAVLTLGSFVQAVCAFLVVRVEIEKKLVGVLRGLGVQQSVFWMSWYLPFAMSSLVNSLLGAITAQFIPVHVFQSVYFGGVFASFFFLQLALVSASFFLAAVCGSNHRLIILMIILMLVSIWIPTFHNVGWEKNISPSTVYSGSKEDDFSGLLWTNRNTTTLVDPYSYGGTYTYYNNGNYYVPDQMNNDTCNKPIMNEEQGTFYKTEEEKMDVTPDEFFIGCYIQPGFTSAIFHPVNSGAEFGLFSLFWVPYFHFTAIYSNMLGYTGTPGKTFGPSQANQSPEELAISNLPSPPNEANSNGTSAFPQGSTLRQIDYYDEEAYFNFNCEHNLAYSWDCPNYYVPQDFRLNETSGYYYYYGRGDYVYPDVCPSNNLPGYELCGNSCHYVTEPLTGSPSVHDLLGYLILLSITYLLMASYWLQVFPAGNGASFKFYFFIDPQYWFGAKEIEVIHDGGANESVSIKKVSKSFGQCKAVKDVTLELKSGQVTALLGHNGAGKSTLTNILSCETIPSNGEVSIFGISLGQDPDAIRRMVAICKQDDFLWPNLTAEEHLQIFAGLRGVDATIIGTTVRKWLDSVDLGLQRDMFSSAFSGGMKRRLSVALATIGDRPFLILDEPTTGMDPVSRRFVWQHLEDVKEDRVVLLTTHAMEEADLLADEVAIMKKGEMVALGSPLELKSEHGSAIQFSILVDKSDKASTEASIIRMFQGSLEYVKVTSGDAGNITVRIDKVKSSDDLSGVEVSSLADFVSWLESDDSKVTEYGFSNSSLEEVFIAITKGDDNFEDSDDVPEPTSEEVEVEEEQPSSLPQNGDVAEFASKISSQKPSLTVRNQIWALLRLSYIRKWYGKRSIFEYIIYGVAVLGTILLGTLIAFDADYVTGSILALPLPAIAGMSLLLVSTALPIYRDKSTGLFHLMRTQGLRQSSYLGGLASFTFLNHLFFGLVIWTLFYATPLFRETQLCPGTCGSRNYYYGFNSSDPTLLEENDDEAYCEWGWYEDGRIRPGSVGHATPTCISMKDESILDFKVTRTAGGYFNILAIPLLFAFSMPGALFLSSVIPGNLIISLTIVGFFAIIASISTPLYTLFWFLDHYYDDSFFDYYTYPNDYKDPFEECKRLINPDDICDGGISEAMGPEQALNCIGLSLHEDTVRFISPSLCASPLVSLLPQFGAHQLFSYTIFSGIKFWPDSMVRFREMFPDADCSGDICNFPFAQGRYHAHARYFLLGGVLLNILGLAIFIFVWFPPSFVLKYKLFLSNIFGRFKCWGTRVEETGDDIASEEIQTEEVTAEKSKVNGIVQPFLGSRDIDSIEQGRENTLLIDYKAKSLCEDLPPILMHKLRKVYPASGRTPPKVALHSLDLHVLKGQVCGLLGKNGSGKTTALKILSNEHKASAGIGLVSGYDVRSEKIKACESLGNCPQFDKIWPFLSVQNHLEFFARLKGIRDVKETAKAIADAVGLGTPEVYSRQAGNLSGGMRRRLSIAISFVGAPDVLLLDEPTTGLDPSTRNEIWALISAFATEGRAVVITTHMMIEADTLCNRIAIIGQGKLRVVASQQHLKDKYGSGYILQLNLTRSTQEHQDRAMSFVRTHLHEDAVLDNKQAKTLHVHLPRDINLNMVFSALYSPERSTEGCINQFLLSQSSLEDVFLALGN